MDLDRKLVVRRFYQEHYENLLEMLWYGRCHNFTPPFERILALLRFLPIEVSLLVQQMAALGGVRNR
jgi:hypothetical protein